MSQWTIEDFEFIMDKNIFPNCIECSDDYAKTTRTHFFHKNGCSRGADNWEQTNSRLDDRLEVFNKLYRKDGQTIIKCKECHENATGKIKVFFHDKNIVAEEWYVCLNHAYHSDSVGRESKYESI